MKRIILTILLLLTVLTMTAVSASDNMTDEVISSQQDDVLSVKDNGTFTALQNKINNAEAGSTIVLENDYTYDNGFSTDGIEISQKYAENKSFTIDGNGHTLNGLAKIQNIQSSLLECDP